MLSNSTFAKALRAAIIKAQEPGSCTYMRHGHPLCVAAQFVNEVRPDLVHLLSEHSSILGDSNVRTVLMPMGLKGEGDRAVLLARLQSEWDNATWIRGIIYDTYIGKDPYLVDVQQPTVEQVRWSMHLMLDEWMAKNGVKEEINDAT